MDTNTRRQADWGRWKREEAGKRRGRDINGKRECNGLTAQNSQLSRYCRLFTTQQTATTHTTHVFTTQQTALTHTIHVFTTQQTAMTHTTHVFTTQETATTYSIHPLYTIHPHLYHSQLLHSEGFYQSANSHGTIRRAFTLS